MLVTSGTGKYGALRTIFAWSGFMGTSSLGLWLELHVGECLRFVPRQIRSLPFLEHLETKLVGRLLPIGGAQIRPHVFTQKPRVPNDDELIQVFILELGVRLLELDPDFRQVFPACQLLFKAPMIGRRSSRLGKNVLREPVCAGNAIAHPGP